MPKKARKTFQPQHHPFRMGRRRPLARCPRFSLRNYLMKDLSPPPASCDYSAKAGKALSQLYLNDKFGDCVIAGIGHVVGVLTAGAGNQFVYSDDQILQLYEAIGGYVPNHPNTDDGCDEQTALNYWQHHGAPSGTHKIAGWVAVNGADPNEYRTALWLFENLYFRPRIARQVGQSDADQAGLHLGGGRPAKSGQRTLCGRRGLQQQRREDLHLGHARHSHRRSRRKIRHHRRVGRALHRH